MVKWIFLQICILIFLSIMCFGPTIKVMAADCDDGDTRMTPTGAGDLIYPDNWLDGGSDDTEGTLTLTPSSETISAGGSITLDIDSTGHLSGPYTFTITNNGGSYYSLNTYSSRALPGSVTLSCSSAYVSLSTNIWTTVTITDSNGVTAYITIRNAAGKWNSGTGVNAVIPTSGSGWNCSCGDYCGYWGCSTDGGITWYDSDQFNGEEGPLSGTLSNFLYLGCTGSVFWVIGTSSLSNPCNIDTGNCDDSPYCWGPWAGKVNGESPPMGVSELSSFLLANYCKGVYHNDYGASFGGQRSCPGDRVGARAVRGYMWVCK